MSTAADAESAIPGCRPAEATPVTIDGDAFDPSSDAAVRALKRELDAASYVAAELAVGADFGADGSLATQAEADRVREYLRAADLLGAGTVRLVVERVADARTVRPAVSALRERAEREGIALVVDGPNAHDL